LLQLLQFFKRFKKCSVVIQLAKQLCFLFRMIVLLFHS
jgi:hypothetical protein